MNPTDQTPIQMPPEIRLIKIIDTNFLTMIITSNN